MAIQRGTCACCKGQHSADRLWRHLDRSTSTRRPGAWIRLYGRRGSIRGIAANLRREAFETVTSQHLDSFDRWCWLIDSVENGTVLRSVPTKTVCRGAKRYLKGHDCDAGRRDHCCFSARMRRNMEADLLSVADIARCTTRLTSTSCIIEEAARALQAWLSSGSCCARLLCGAA